jgi:hypothetical protein
MLPITQERYLKFSADEWSHIPVTTTKDLKNNRGEKIPAGTLVRITHKRDGFNIINDHTSVRISGVKPEELTIGTPAPAPQVLAQ